MTATEVKRRRGTEAQCDAMTPVEGELIVDTTNDRMRVGDGSTAGGIEIPNAIDIQKGTFNTVNSSGTNTITVTLDPVPASYFTNMTIVFKAANTISGAATMNVNGLGAKNIYKVSSGSLVAVASGDIVVGAYYTIRYDGTQFVLEGSAGGVSSVTAGSGLTISPTTGAVVAGINTNNALGVGAYAILSTDGVVIVNAGATVAGSSLLQITSWQTTGVIAASGGVSGTWRNVSGANLNTNRIGLFIRIA